MRNPIKAVAARAEASVKSGVQERVRTHFEENKTTYVACAATAFVVAGVSSKFGRPVVNVTVVNHLS